MEAAGADAYPDAPEASRRAMLAADRLGLPYEFKTFDQSTRTAEDAARALNCSVSDIGKTLIFRGKLTKRPFLVLVSGKNRANEKTLATVIGENLEKADAEFVRKSTGYAIGGVTPVGLANRMPVLMDENLYERAKIWIAAGTPNRVLGLSTMMLARAIAARIIKLD